MDVRTGHLISVFIEPQYYEMLIQCAARDVRGADHVVELAIKQYVEGRKL